MTQETQEAIPVMADASDPKASVVRLSKQVSVAAEWMPSSWSFRALTPGTHEAGPWRVWHLRHKGQEQPHTKVIQGPAEIIVSGDLAAFIFERPSGGLSLSFWTGGLHYAAEKATVGQVFTYSTLAAKRDLLAAIDGRVDDEEMSPEMAAALKDEAEDLDYDDEERVHDFYFAKVNDDRGEYPNLGQVYTNKFLWAVACIRAVCDYENKESTAV